MLLERRCGEELNFIEMQQLCILLVSPIHCMLCEPSSRAESKCAELSFSNYAQELRKRRLRELEAGEEGGLPAADEDAERDVWLTQIQLCTLTTADALGSLKRVWKLPSITFPLHTAPKTLDDYCFFT